MVPKGKNAIVIGVSECRTSKDRDSYLVTYALGSCIGLAAYDPGSGVGGLLHFQLPDSTMDREMAESHPAMFADTGLQLLLSKLTRLGGDPKRTLIRIAGGAQMIGGPKIHGLRGSLMPGEGTGVGKQNYLAIRKLLWRHGLMLEGEAVGGGQGRTLGLTIGTGEFWVTSPEPGSIAV